MNKDYVPRIRKNYVKENPINPLWMPWMKPFTDEALHGNEPYMVYTYESHINSSDNYFRVVDKRAITDDRYYNFFYGTAHSYIENGIEYISKGTIYLKDSIKIYAFCPRKSDKWAEFTIWHDGLSGKPIYYLYSLQHDKISNYMAYKDGEEIRVWRDLCRDDIEFIESVLNTKLPNCYIGNLLLKQCKALWEAKHPKEDL